ncbi:unnamed protein product [Bursaphelenchus okinawaensis]|uniref:DIS3-like exonuclease 2 n=1 Tax=Bursaphelenchus okinawaensis TaxID=465554 RepID=A0A811LNH9_9BILA|nr:unnamed protein product [Bursaphelenchus okinawaensis]CAG9126307.1 unnamed protein product [Bursaphelenchus okinawaensis]
MSKPCDALFSGTEQRLDECQLAVIRQIQTTSGAKPKEKKKKKKVKRIRVEELLENSSEPSESVSQSYAARQSRIKAHHQHLLDSAVRTDRWPVNAPGFPKAAHANNPTSTLVKPDMMISAFTAGLTTQQTITEMSLPGFPNGIFGSSIRNAQELSSSTESNPVLDSLFALDKENKKSGAELIKSLTRSPGNSVDLSTSVAAILHPSKSVSSSAVYPNSSMLHDRGNIQTQKMRKPYFMPYMNTENVEKGLRSGDLIKGIIRINQRNFEEAYIDNPEGDEKQDIMILGVHDRNRALHCDEVVVRFKDRNHWILRDSLYEAWRSGHLKITFDDDGTPLTVPPVKSEDVTEKEQLAQAVDFLPVVHQQKLEKVKIKEPVSYPKNKRYSQEMMLKIAAQMEMQRIQHENRVAHVGKKQDKVEERRVPTVELDNEAATQISRLNIAKTKFSAQGEAGSGTFASNRRSVNSTNTLQRRLNYRVLGDMPDDDWGIPDVCLQKTAEVVYIYKNKNCRTAVGQLKVMADGNKNWGLFSPNDSRFPRMFIAANELPKGFFERPHDFSKNIYIAKVAEWQATAQFARGTLYKSLGTVGDVDAETEGILMSNDVDTREFSAAALASLPVVPEEGWSIDEAEFKYRRDFRTECLFTIDPATARDLDDALHIKPIEDCDGKGAKGWEVGVHIADVSYFVKENTELDTWAKQRATSVYLVHKVIPMLPRMLCEDLCSLNPGVDRLTFSVVWKMDLEGNIQSEWFGRSFIHSCVKLAYDHAQYMIEHPEEDVNVEALPEVFNNMKVQKIKECVLNLNKLATAIKNRRIEGGSLRLDATKLKFALDQDKGLPIGVCTDERKEANFLVEEFMLLANQSVAKKIESHFPDTALLRRHPSPKQKVMRETSEKLELLHFPIETESSHSIAQSLTEYYNDPRLRSTVFPVLVNFMMKAMQLAVYFCTGTVKDYHHYALNMDFYTHFTSPIRRYPDVVVHRLLAAALEYSPAPSHTVESLEEICKDCNEKKVNAKAVSEQSAEMFFALFVKEAGSLEVLGVVTGVLDAAFDVLLPKYGLIKRVYTNRLKVSRDCRFVEGTPGALYVYWDPNYIAQVRKVKPKDDKEKKEEDTKDTEVKPKYFADCGDSDEEEEEPQKSVDEDESDDGHEVYHNAMDYEQTLSVFSVIKLVLTPSPEPVKFVATLLPTPDKYRMRPNEIQKLLS